MKPWLEIPLSDYEEHMASAEVGQLQVLSDLFAEAIHRKPPASVALLGIAGGNGLDRIDPEKTSRIVGIDINPLYLDAVRSRYPHLPGLELHCIDLGEDTLDLEPVDLVHAALIFEHAGLGRCLDNALSLLADEGMCSVVLQLPCDSRQNVGLSGIASIQRLAADFSLIDPSQLRASLEEHGFRLVHETRASLPEGKALWMGNFARV